MTLAVDKSTWTKMKFEDFVQNVTDRVNDPSTSGADRYVGLEHLDPGTMVVSRWGSPDEVEAQKLRFRSGDVIFGRRRAYQRKVARADFDGICSAHALVLRARPERVHPDFLPVFLSSDLFLDRAIKISVGSLSPTVNWRDLRVQEFLLPPLPDQQRIADLLWAAERHRESLVKVVEQIQAAKRTAIIELCNPGGVESKTLGELADVLDHKRVPVSESERAKRPGDVPYYGATGRVGWIDDHLFDEELVLIGEDGAPFSEWREKPIAYEITGPSWVNNHAHVLRATGISHRWLLYSLMHYAIEPYVTGTTRGKLNLSSLKKLRIAIPSDEADLVTKIDVIGASALRVAAELEQVLNLVTSLRSDFFGQENA